MQQLKNISIVILSTLLGGIASYLYHPIMSHYLSETEFARFESLAGMFTILATITAGFSLYLTRAFAHTVSEHTGRLYRGSQRMFVFVGIGIYLLYLPWIPWIDSLLSIGSPLMVGLIGLIIPVSFFSIAPGSWLQGRGRFGFLSVYGVLASFGKLAFGWILVAVGFGVYGAIGGFICSATLATLYIVIWIQRDQGGGEIDSTRHIVRYFWRGRVELFHFFLLSFLLALFQNMDLVLVNRYFTGDIAGQYALASIMMKFVIFIALSVETVYYPRLAHPAYQIRDLTTALGLLSLGSIAGYILLQLGGIYVLQRIHPVFIEYQELIPYLYIFCILFVWVSFVMKVAIAQRLYLVNIWVFIVSVGLFGYLHMQSMMTPLSYIGAYIVALALALVISFSYLLYGLIYSPSSNLDEA